MLIFLQCIEAIDFQVETAQTRKNTVQNNAVISFWFPMAPLILLALLFVMATALAVLVRMASFRSLL